MDGVPLQRGLILSHSSLLDQFIFLEKARHNHRNIWLEGTQSLAHSEPPIQTGYLRGYDGFRPSLHAFLTCIWHHQTKSLERRKRAASSNDFWKYCIIGGNYKFCRACPVCSPPVLQQNNGVLSFKIYFIFH